VRYCVYDNPATMCREVWVDGRLVEHWTLDLLLTSRRLGSRAWRDGRVLGDATALVEEPEPEPPA
jgi:hypothetical protein